MKVELIWEQIDNYHKRARVPGGWLVKAYEDVTMDRTQYGQGLTTGYEWRVTMCFVPDPNYSWENREVNNG